jgi:cell wall-associated NlpC family hydrolase
MLTMAEANTHYTVKKGDNLFKIAKKFKVPVNELRETNNLDSDDLSIGKKLTIPSKKSSAPDKSAKKAKRDTTGKKSEAAEKQPILQEKSNTAESGDYDYHVVKKGETPAKIAKKYGLSVRELKQLNHMTSNKLKVGRKLIVGTAYAEEEKAPDSAGPIKRVDVSEKIEEVKVLSESDELSKMSATDRLMLFAKKMLNLPYKFGGNGIFGLDCSSFVQKVYGFVGQPLPRSAREQFKVGEEINKSELQSGDLLFFRTYASFPSHVGIYIGNNMFIHASSRAKKVQIDNLDAPYYVKRFIGAKRPLSEPEPTVAEIGVSEGLSKVSP